MSLRLPIDCDLNENCWMMNYVDVDPDTGVARDFTCNKRSYEGHKGVDIAVRSMYEVEKGVDVLAAAAGTVLRFRGGEKDGFKTPQEFADIREARKECGNGIIIDNGDGWLTQYCHLKEGSIIVEEGQKVRAMQPIAKVGMSGITEHPHIHLSVLHEGKHIDPFTGLNKDDGCEARAKKSLWRSSEVSYSSFALYDAGFIAERPDFLEISKGNKEPLPSKDSEVMIFWIAYFGAKPRDVVDLKVYNPDGEVVVSRSITQESEKARQYYFIGKKKPLSGWGRGTYRGEVTVSRDGEEPQVIKKAVDIY